MVWSQAAGVEPSRATHGHVTVSQRRPPGASVPTAHGRAHCCRHPLGLGEHPACWAPRWRWVWSHRTARLLPGCAETTQVPRGHQQVLPGVPTPLPGLEVRVRQGQGSVGVTQAESGELRGCQWTLEEVMGRSVEPGERGGGQLCGDGW